VNRNITQTQYFTD